MNVYQKIQKELDKGKTVLVDLSCKSEIKERFRLLTKKSAYFDWINSSGVSMEPCCWHEKKLVDCNLMKEFDKSLQLKVNFYQVLD